MADPIESKVRAPLQEEAAVLREQLDAIDARKFDDNFADSGQVAAEKGEAQTLAANLQEQFDDIEAALRKLDDGAYGECEKCGEAIGDARLEAVPASRFCINHA